MWFEPSWMRAYGPDLLAIVSSVVLVGAYYARLHARVRRDPESSIHFVNETARRLWVEQVMADPSCAVMAVQTLRNFIMVGIVMVSTVAMLTIGTLTLSGEAESLGRSWHVVSLVGPPAAEIWTLKVLCLLADFVTSFFAFTMSIRLANQVLFMVNIPASARVGNEALAPAAVARRLNEAGYLLALGIRLLFGAVPLVFWLFGPAFLVLATFGLLVALHRLDRSRVTG